MVPRRAEPDLDTVTGQALGWLVTQSHLMRPDDVATLPDGRDSRHSAGLDGNHTRLSIGQWHPNPRVHDHTGESVAASQDIATL